MREVFKTPNGVPVGLNPEYVFKTIANEKNFATYLAVIEAYYTFPRIFSAAFFFICIFLFQNTTHHMLALGCIILIIRFGSFLTHYLGPGFIALLVMPIIGPICQVYAFLFRFFIPPIAMIICTIITGNYLLLIGYVLAILLNFIITLALDNLVGKQIYKKHQIHLQNRDIFALKLLNTFSADKTDYTFTQRCESYRKYLETSI